MPLVIPTSGDVKRAIRCIAAAHSFRDTQRRVRRRSLPPESPRRKKLIMDNSKTDQAKGRIKQAAGDLTNDERLRREGKMDEGAGKAKEKTNDFIDKVRDKVDNND